MRTLRLISEKHLTQTPLEPDEEEFLRNTIEYVPDYFGVRTFSGWYPQLFYQAFAPFFPPAEQLHSSDQWDALVTSFHTDVPSPMAGDPGGVVHAGVGNVNMLLIAVDNGPDRMMYAGPVFSFYEFTAPAFTRHTNEEWKQRILDNALPAAPEWTLDYLAPGAIDIPWYAR